MLVLEWKEFVSRLGMVDLKRSRQEFARGHGTGTVATVQYYHTVLLQG